MSNRVQLSVETLRADAAALFSFIDSIRQFCVDRDSPAYLDPSKEFFKYIRGLGDATKAYLNIFSEKAPRDPRLYQGYRQKLETIRSAWFEFHQFIKPAIDADTLSMPYPLVEALTRRLNKIKGLEKTKFVLFHLDEVNYLQIRVSEVKRTADRLATIIPDSDPFPADLGMIGIPYSQSSPLYLNCLIAHEIGHFVFQKFERKKKLLPEVEQCLKTSLSSHAATPEMLDWSRDRLLSWAEELFCDLFATAIVGPCYSLAYVELFGLTTVLSADPSIPSGYSLTTESIIFSRSHPADFFRLKQHVALLKGNSGWWKRVEAIRSHYVDVLEAAASVPDTNFVFYTHEQAAPYAAATLQGFFALALLIENVVSQVTQGLDSGVSEYERFGTLIEAHLERAVVPSTVFDGQYHWYPDIVALLNASMKFSLESLEKLMKSVKGQKPFIAGHRSRWINRIESLTSKAIEDHYLLATEKGTVSVGGSFKRADLSSTE
jgi:hypothetical protein